MNDQPIYHITRRVHQEPPIRDESDGTWLGAVILFCIAALVVGAAVWSAWK